MLPNGEVTIDQCARELFTKIAPTHTLFWRGGAVTEMVKRKGELVLDVLSPAAARSRLESLAGGFITKVIVRGAEAWKPKTLPEDMARALMESIPARELLPPVDSIVSCALLVPDGDGTKVIGSGYHYEQSVLVANQTEPKDVPLNEAVERLLNVLADFSFQSEGDKSRAVASIITPGLKMAGWIKGFVPCDVAEADDSQSGKTYRQRLVAAIYNEDAAVVTMKKGGGVGGLDESLNSKLISGRPFILFDNLRGRLDSPHLEAFLTATSRFPARIPHKCEIEIDPTKFFVMLTSNGVDATKDLANRSSIIKIHKQRGKVWRTFPEGDLRAHVLAKHDLYIGSVFAVIKAWVAAGKPTTGCTEHDFREWVGILDWIVQNIFKLAPIMSGHQQVQEQVSSPALVWLRAVAIAAEAKKSLSKDLSASDLADICEETDIEIPGAAQKLEDEQVRARRVGGIMKRAFGDRDQVVVDRYLVTRWSSTETREGKGLYTCKKYRFELTSPQSPQVTTIPPMPQMYRKTDRFSKRPDHCGDCGDCGGTKEDFVDVWQSDGVIQPSTLPLVESTATTNQSFADGVLSGQKDAADDTF
jgi:hypothetical protein